MSYKRHWDAGKTGLASIYKKEDSACQGLEVSMLKLNKGMSENFFEKDKEIVFTILGGNCDIVGDGFEFKKIGSRKNVWDGKATAVYVGRNTKAAVTANDDDLVICVAYCQAEEDFEPQLVTPDDVVVKDLGKPGFERQAHFIYDERFKANHIYLGENFIKGGQWSSYPGHKHDTENMPAEGFAEEIYYYEYDKPTGYGIQQVYTGDKSVDEAYAVRNNDFVEIPVGYHPCTVAAGYNGYLLWLMCCNHRGFYMSTDPDHAWLNK